MWKKLIKISFVFVLMVLLAKPVVVQAAEDGTSWNTAKGLKIGTTTIVNGVQYYYYKNTTANPIVLKIQATEIDGENSYPYMAEYIKARTNYSSVYDMYNEFEYYSKIESGESGYYKIQNASSGYTGSFNVTISVASFPNVSVGQQVTTVGNGESAVYVFTAPQTGMYALDFMTKDEGYVDVLSLDHKYGVPTYDSSFYYDGKISGMYLMAGCQYAVIIDMNDIGGTITWNMKKASNVNNPVLTLQTIPTQIYDGYGWRPEPILYYKGYDIKADLNGSCYWTYGPYNNIKPGTAIGVIYYNFEYEGSTFSGLYYTTFQIAQDIGVADVSGVTSPAYTGQPVAPKATVKISGKTLKEGVDYKIVADSNGNAGTGRTATIQGIGKYTYTKKISYTISKGIQTIQSNPTFITYKKAKKFALGATASGALTYASSNVKVATVDKNGKVKPKGYGKAVITIQAAATSNVNAASKKVTVIVTSKSTKVTSVKSIAKKKATVKIKKATGAQGYEISYSMDQNFKSGVKTVNTKKASTTLKKLKSKKTYYVRVRSYRKVKGEKLYSEYSAVKKVKIK